LLSPLSLLLVFLQLVAVMVKKALLAIPLCLIALKV
jgi:hypothetical protein